MALIKEHVPQEEWEFFNSLNIQFEGQHITANEYSAWVIDREREIIYTMIQTPGRDYGRTYILIWMGARVYIYVESHSELHTDEGVRKYHWDIQKVTAPISLKDKRDELVDLIRQLAIIDNKDQITSVFVIDNIAEPRFIEGV